jgi:hypothetical protein
MPRRIAALALAATLAVLAGAPPSHAANVLVSRTSDGNPVPDQPDEVSVSPDGRYAAFTDNTLVIFSFNPGVYVKDRRTGQLRQGNRDASGSAGFGGATRPAISADGRFVAFLSPDALVPEDTNAVVDAYRKDLDTGAIKRVSLTAAGAESQIPAVDLAMSEDAAVVAVLRRSTGALTFSELDIRDVAAGTTTVVASGLDLVDQPAVSPDGRFVAWRDDNPALVPNDTNSAGDVFELDRSTAAITRVSVASGGGEANGLSLEPSVDLAGDVAFGSDATNLVGGLTDANGARDIFLHDRGSGSTTLVSISAASSISNGSSLNPSITADGRWVAFGSLAGNLVAGDTNGISDVFTRDMRAGLTRRVSLRDGNAQTAGVSRLVSGRRTIGETGRWVALFAGAELTTGAGFGAYLVDSQPNTPPTAAFAATPGTTFADVDAAASSDPDGWIAGYAYTFGDGATAGASAGRHTFDRGGTFTVGLTVTDNEGAVGTSSRSVVVPAAALPSVPPAPPIVRPPVTSAPGTAPAPSAAARAKPESVRRIGGGRLRLRLRCASTATRGCSGTLRLALVARGNKRTRLRSAAYAVARGKRVDVVVATRGTARGLLRHPRGLRLQISQPGTRRVLLPVA